MARRCTASTKPSFAPKCGRRDSSWTVKVTSCATPPTRATIRQASRKCPPTSSYCVSCGPLDADRGDAGDARSADIAGRACVIRAFMNLHRLLLKRAADGTPLRVVLVGAGKFGSMFLAQARNTRGIHVIAVADLAPDRARAALATTGWPAARTDARSCADAVARGTTFITDDAVAAIAAAETQIVIDATGSPAAGIDHVLAC